MTNPEGGENRTAENFYSEIESVLGWPDGFIQHLLKRGDDWTLTLRLAAIIESALTHLVAVRLHISELDEWVAELSLQGRSSKLTIARALAVIDAREERVIRAIAQIRNKYAHDPHMMRRTLEDHVAALSTPEFNQLARDLGELIGVRSQPNEQAWRAFLSDDPGTMLWLAAFVIIVRAYDVRKRNLVGQLLTVLGYDEESR